MNELGEAENSDSYYKQPMIVTKNAYGIVPEWIPLFFSNDKLAPWHGGCAWIFQTDEKSPISGFLQLRRGFKSNERYLRIYSRDELIAHEMAHIGRMAYDEPKFEEFLAYQSSENTFRKYCGGLIESALESMLFAIVLLFVLLTDIFILFFYPENLYVSLWLKVLPGGMIALACLRLAWKHRTFKRCLKNVSPFAKNSLAFVYRLTDREIRDFSKWEEDKIRNYIDRQNGLRWRGIKSSIS